MLNTLQALFEKLTAPVSDEPPAEREHALRLAAAVLLVEVMRAEPSIDAAERDTVAAALRVHFSLPAEELAALLALAEGESKLANDYFRFTSHINEQCGQPEKVALVEAMWQVAYADAHVGAHEIHLISKIAGLLHVPHGEYIAAKMRAKHAVGAG